MLEFRLLCGELTRPLQAFFQEMKSTGEEKFFHPHPLDNDTAKRLCEEYRGSDLYYAVVYEGKIVGYGLMRGWDEEYSVPSLGIALSRSVRGKGIGTSFMRFMHSAAKLKGSSKILLKVYKDNSVAFNLYSRLGYVFTASEGEQAVGHLDL
jgi:ribosomal-protein-alanine N-acetyltransferase